ALGGVRIAPIALANVRSVYPNLPDAIGSQPSQAVGVNNGDALTKHVPPAADNTSGIGAACRRRNPLSLKRLAANVTYERTRTPAPRRDQYRCFGQSIEGMGGPRVESVRTEGCRKPLDGIGTYRFGRIERYFPAGQIEVFQLIGAKP